MSSNPLSSKDPPEGQFMVPSQPLPGGHSVTDAAEIAAQSGENNRASVSTGPGIDEAAKQNFLWQTHQYLGEYARFGDSKAGFAGAIAAALLGALYSAKAHVSLIQTPYSQWPIASWFAVVSGVFLIGCISLAIWTVLPRVRSTQWKGFIFWDSIAAHRNVETLQTSFHGQSGRTLNDHLLHHVFEISSNVCIPKYRAVRLCICALVIGGFLAGAALILQDIPRKSGLASPPTVTAPLISSEKSKLKSP